MIEIEHTQSAAALGTFAQLQGNTAVGKLIASLSSKTTTKGALVDQAVVAKRRGLANSYRVSLSK